MASGIVLFVFLWTYWLSDVFSPAERMQLPNFVGSSYETISKDVSLTSKYNFTVNYVVDTSTPAGTVISQEPVAGRSLMVTEEGMNVRLNVSTGFILTEVPNVVGLDYREASLNLQNAGFAVEISNVVSSSSPKDQVIGTSPAASEKISAGSTVYVTVSAGAQVSYVRMPNLIGLTEDAAVAKLQNAHSDYEAGTVIAQSVVAFAEVEELTRITLTVSSGPGYMPGVFY